MSGSFSSAPPVALVTGASGDIGSAVVSALRAAGAVVVATDVQLPRWQAVDHNLVQARCDVTSSDDVSHLLALVEEELGRLDVVVTCAGIEGAAARIEDYPLDDFRRVLDVNVTGTFLVLGHALRLMRAQGSGSIVTIASTAGRRGSPMLSGYIASKHAVIGLTRAAAAETAADGIRVNAVCPGPVSGRMISAIDAAVGAPTGAGAVRTPMGRYGLPEEVAAMVRHLALDSPFSTGSIVMVDGGRTAV
jgi:3alpha(or 20beta)-hydroxysteroid dehydrogenase